MLRDGNEIFTVIKDKRRDMLRDGNEIFTIKSAINNCRVIRIEVFLANS
jgi:hypothetical protein